MAPFPHIEYLDCCSGYVRLLTDISHQGAGLGLARRVDHLLPVNIDRLMWTFRLSRAVEAAILLSL